MLASSLKMDQLKRGAKYAHLHQVCDSCNKKFLMFMSMLTERLILEDIF